MTLPTEGAESAPPDDSGIPLFEENDAGEFQVRKHTIDMPPGTRRTYRVRADALGRWAYHCHLLFHMESGMFREVAVLE